MRNYFRVVDKSNEPGIENVAAVVRALIESNPTISELRPPERQPRGGYSLLLDVPDEDVEVVLKHLRDSDLLPCI
ncbi:MAG: hypothetical protein DWQ31_08655 [Planctomycetota bacterium]|nr:MAG: hypothetical protein DWQ31_08655 [Planctomycetota bacterium]REJ86938.1 MAG: hypothetical protein DWQ35_22515 [Planctomycetota bacterium]REK24935.1 MAG: hypothetical protein DWQ42_12655 [Planctomycetota bacterium]REK48524.1 MAG: hypothetical protein DWQ46_02185 [Planctomycetota bacterium]